MTIDLQSVTLLGSEGGLAQAVLALLNRAIADPADPLYGNLRNCRLYLIDIRSDPSSFSHAAKYPNLADRLEVHALDLRNLEAFRQHLCATRTTLVIDLSWADTLQMLECCNELGIRYVNTALENTEVDEDPTLYGFPLTERFERFESRRSEFDQVTAIVCSGMNPGVVQWMALELMNESPGRVPRACYIVEKDTSFYTDASRVKPDTVYASWSVECFLDEAILSYPMFMKDRIPHYFREEVYSAEYLVRLGNETFYGCLMPHEEVLTLGQLHNWETGFLYRVSEYTTNQIRAHLDNVDVLWNWQEEIISPSKGDVDGEDLVGVLLVYEDEERYLYNVMSSKDIYPLYGTNGTYFQVACGVYAALACLWLDPVPKGVHFVDEWLRTGTACRYGEYVRRHMKRFERGTNPNTDGLLTQRRREVN